jgi:radical SAM superfamily enzyme YgiQ (UPF0313 family)
VPQGAGERCYLPIIIPSYYGNDDRKGERLQQHYWVQLLSPAFLTLKSIAREAAQKLHIDLDVQFYEERLQRGDRYLGDIVRRGRTGERVLVFISCKSLELARGCDIARQLQAAGVTVVMGGPGITLSDVKTYGHLHKQGICFNVGEGESTIPLILADFLEGRLRPCYVQEGYVDLAAAPMPSHPRPAELRGAVGGYIGLSTSEGCPFDCSYCSEWILRGRGARARDPHQVADWVEEAYKRFGYYRFFITDDNFRRSPKYRQTVDSLTRLNSRLGGILRFMVQVDVKNLAAEVPALAEMGVKRVFVGMESPDPVIVRDILGKHQNDPSLYDTVVRAFHSRDILVDSGWMVGFPHQTPEMILREADQIARMVDFGYPFFVTPLQGTLDHASAIGDGTLRSWDPNDYTTRQPVRDWFQHSTMERMKAAYEAAFFGLFSLRNAPPHGSLGLRWDRSMLRLLARGLAQAGQMLRGVPLHFMMEGWPRPEPVLRPADGFRGFPLTPDDVKPERKEEFLRALGAGFTPAGCVAQD